VAKAFITQVNAQTSQWYTTSLLWFPYLTHYTLVGFETGIFDSGGGRDDHYATPPGRKNTYLHRNFMPLKVGKSTKWLIMHLDFIVKLPWGQFFKRIFAPTEKVRICRNFCAYAMVAPGSVRAYVRVRTYARSWLLL
jgi:hypothetical protein